MKSKNSLLIVGVILLFSLHGRAQTPSSVPENEFNFTLINNVRALKATIAKDSAKQMVSLKKITPTVILDLHYATADNFMHRLMYPANTTNSFMRRPAVLALQKVAEELQTKGLALKIYDAYRPFSVTQKFWELVHDERYVANPAKGSGHNKGVAVDLTIVDTATNKELDMGTGFDNFTDTAHQNFTALPANVLANRKLLRETMTKYGFIVFETEWWHYYWPGNFEVLNLSFDQLDQLAH